MEMNAAKKMCGGSLYEQQPETYQYVEQWCKDMQNVRPKSWENVSLGASNG
jgi:hypothetical protein